MSGLRDKFSHELQRLTSTQAIQIVMQSQLNSNYTLEQFEAVPETPGLKMEISKGAKLVSDED